MMSSWICGRDIWYEFWDNTDKYTDMTGSGGCGKARNPDAWNDRMSKIALRPYNSLDEQCAPIIFNEWDCKGPSGFLFSGQPGG